MTSAETAFDLCVIGGSEAGVAACVGAAGLGLSCTLVDDGDPSGRRNPELTLAALASAATDPARCASTWDYVRDVLNRAAVERRHARLGAMNIRLVRGLGRFSDPRTVLAGGHTIRARRFVIATGGRQPGWRLGDGLPDGVRLSLDDLPHLRTTPPDVVVLGCGPMAVSAAQSLARLGSNVTLAAESLLPDVDPELAAPLLLQLRRDGVTVLSGQFQLAQPTAAGVAARFSDGTIVTASRLLLADESLPAYEALDLARGGIALSGDTLVLDKSLRTTNRRVFAVGRAAGARSSDMGVAQVGPVLRSAFFSVPGTFRPELVPTVTATRPEIATVGRAPMSGMARMWRWPLAQTTAAVLDGDREGQIKVVTDRRDRILWVGIVGPNVRELVSFWTLAITRGLTLAQLAEVPAPVPSLAESSRAIAVSHLGRRLGSPWVRRALAAARWLG